jgi:hypothetical protein
MLPKGLLNIIAMSPGESGILQIETETGILYEFYIKISHTAKILPGTGFSSYSSRNRFRHEAFISKENYEFIFNMIMNPHYYNFEEDMRVRVTPLKKDNEGNVLDDKDLTKLEQAQKENWLTDPIKLETYDKTNMYYGKNQKEIIELIDSVIKSRIQVK